MLAGFISLQAQAAQVTLLDSDGKPVSDAVISLTSPATSGLGPAKPASVNQLGEEFVPKVSVVQVGGDVAFLNQDPTQHHVYSFSPAKQFERKIPARSAPQHVVFDKPGIVDLGCNIHDQMLGFLIVVDTPYFAKTSAAGLADLGDVPPGKYQARIWHPRLKSANSEEVAEVTVTPSGITGLPGALNLKPERRAGPAAEKSGY